MSHNEDPTSSGEEEQETVFLRSMGIRKRMRCSGQTASRIEDAFVTVNQLVDAIESDADLTERDGIGPKTAEVIEDWWQNRFEREEAMDGAEFERTGTKTATIHNLRSWESIIS
jgi:ERCC4-type nuclease